MFNALKRRERRRTIRWLIVYQPIALFLHLSSYDRGEKNIFNKDHLA